MVTSKPVPVGYSILMEGITICLVEDDEAVHEAMCAALSSSGFRVLAASDGHEGLRLATRTDYDLLLLDLVLPGPGGLEILAEVKLTRPTMPVIILSALGQEEDRVRGLRLGADDYVVKPFSVKELLARIEAVLRRSPERPLDLTEINFDGGHIDVARSEVVRDDGKRIDLSEREIELIRYLAGNRGRAISRDEILARVWRLDPRQIETRTIDMHIARLRDKIELNAKSPRVLLTARGKGYMFAAPVRPA